MSREAGFWVAQRFQGCDLWSLLWAAQPPRYLRN